MSSGGFVLWLGACLLFIEIALQPKTLNLKPVTLNLKPETLNLNP